MPRADRLADALASRGLDVVEHRGWETRGSASFNPRGCVIHHTGRGSVDGLAALCINGRADLPGPLCQVLLAPDGACHVIAAGRANHAGRGGWRGLTGNSSVFGIEAVHPGTPDVPWPAIQLAAYVECSAALLDLAGAPAVMCCAHREWAAPPGRKPDPVGIDMDAFRTRVAHALDRRPGPVPSREGNVVINAPPVRILTHLTWPARAYVVVAEDGGTFAFGGAPNHGSLGGTRLNAPIIDAEVTPTGKGWVMLGRDGGIFPFGDAPAYYEEGRVEYRDS